MPPCVSPERQHLPVSEWPSRWLRPGSCVLRFLPPHRSTWHIAHSRLLLPGCSEIGLLHSTRVGWGQALLNHVRENWLPPPVHTARAAAIEHVLPVEPRVSLQEVSNPQPFPHFFVLLSHSPVVGNLFKCSGSGWLCCLLTASIKSQSSLVLVPLHTGAVQVQEQHPEGVFPGGRA